MDLLKPNSAILLTGMLKTFSYHTAKEIFNRFSVPSEKNKCWQETLNYLSPESESPIRDDYFNSIIFRSVLKKISYELFIEDMLSKREGLELVWDNIPIFDLPIANLYPEISKKSYTPYLTSATEDLAKCFGHHMKVAAWWEEDNTLKITLCDNLKTKKKLLVH